MEVEQKIIHAVVKWNKETIPLDVHENDTLEAFRCQLYSLTSVPPDRQKLMFRGKFLKEADSTLSSLGISEVIL